MLKEKLIKELVIFSIILLCGLVAGIMKSVNLPVLNPSDLIKTVFSPFLNSFENFMK